MLANLRAKISQGRRGLSKEDDLERAAIIAIGAMMASGSADQLEMAAATALIYDRFNGTFSKARIERELGNAEQAHKGGRFTFKSKLTAACEQVESDAEREALWTLAADIAASSSEPGEEDISTAEKAYLKQLGQDLRFNTAPYGI